MQRSPLTIFDENRPVKTTETGELVLPPTFSKTAIKFLDIFLSSGERKNIFADIDYRGLQPLIELSTLLVQNPELGKQITIRTVFGATTKMPTRALVYLLPAIQLVEALQKISIADKHGKKVRISLPKIEFIFMNQAGIMANNLDSNMVTQQTDLFVAVAKNYIKEFHPSLCRSTTFMDDSTFTPSVIQLPIYSALIKHLQEHQQEQAILDLRTMGENHQGEEDQSLKYGALHSFVHDVILKDIAFKPLAQSTVNSADTKFLISIGAQPEKRFYAVRQLLLEMIKELPQVMSIQTIQYLANISVPPYSPLPSNDPSLADTILNPNSTMISEFEKQDDTWVHTPVKQALKALSADCGSFQMIDFFRECQDILLKTGIKSH